MNEIERYLNAKRYANIYDFFKASYEQLLKYNEYLKNNPIINEQTYKETC